MNRENDYSIISLRTSFLVSILNILLSNRNQTFNFYTLQILWLFIHVLLFLMSLTGIILGILGLKSNNKAAAIFGIIISSINTLFGFILVLNFYGVISLN